MAELQAIINELRAGRQDTDHTGLNPETEGPFHGLIVDTSGRVIVATRELVADIPIQIIIVGFWG